MVSPLSFQHPQKSLTEQFHERLRISLTGSDGIIHNAMHAVEDNAGHRTCVVRFPLTGNHLVDRKSA
jgi:hypothetical protein